jgi:hypothetical protein
MKDFFSPHQSTNKDNAPLTMKLIQVLAVQGGAVDLDLDTLGRLLFFGPGSGIG